MRALELDFHREDLRARWAGAALLAVALAGTLAVAAQYRHVAAGLAQAEADVRESGIAAKRKSIPHPSGDLQKVGLAIKRADEILLRLKLPWNALFASVESGSMPNVALLAIESDTDKGRVKISGEARDLEAMLDYLRFLGTQPTLAEVYLQSHQVQQQDPQRPVRFVLSADWTARR
jgi:Tfp pilus assembly protein PilN